MNFRIYVKAVIIKVLKIILPREVSKREVQIFIGYTHLGIVQCTGNCINLTRFFERSGIDKFCIRGVNGVKISWPN